MTALTLIVRVDTTRGSTEVSTKGNILRIGSAHGCDLQLDDPAVARIHAIIEAENADTVFVINIGDGVQLNGKRVTLKTRVYHGDVIEVGRSAAKITFLGVGTASPDSAPVEQRAVERAMCIEREGGHLHGTAWCGKSIGPTDCYIPGIDRFVRNTATAHTQTRACPACCTAIKGVLDTAALTVEERAKVVKVA